MNAKSSNYGFQNEKHSNKNCRNVPIAVLTYRIRSNKEIAYLLNDKQKAY